MKDLGTWKTIARTKYLFWFAILPFLIVTLFFVLLDLWMTDGSHYRIEYKLFWTLIEGVIVWGWLTKLLPLAWSCVSRRPIITISSSGIHDGLWKYSWESIENIDYRKKEGFISDSFYLLVKRRGESDMTEIHLSVGIAPPLQGYIQAEQYFRSI